LGQKLRKSTDALAKQKRQKRQNIGGRVSKIGEVRRADSRIAKIPLVFDGKTDVFFRQKTNV